MKRASKARLDEAISSVGEVVGILDRIRHDEVDDRIVQEFATRAIKSLRSASVALTILREEA